MPVLTVKTERDVVDATDSHTSLQEVIVIANEQPGADEIVFDFGHDGPQTILLENGELEVTDALTVRGDGVTLTNGRTTGSGGAIKSEAAAKPAYGNNSPV